jgi:hypothetical protein
MQLAKWRTTLLVLAVTTAYLNHRSSGGVLDLDPSAVVHGGRRRLGRSPVAAEAQGSAARTLGLGGS